MSDKSGGSFQDSLNDWLVSIIVAVALAFCIRTFIFEPYKVEGTSMYPTLFNQERLIVNKFGYFLDDPKRGKKIDEPYTWKEDPKGLNHSNYRKSLVPKDHIFVLGDNRNNSEDSRFADVDFVPLRLVKGKAAVVFWPFERFRKLP